MAFHLEKPYINNIGSTKKKLTAKQLRAKADHQAWLKANNVHPDQLAARATHVPRKLTVTLKVDTSGPPVSNGFAPGGAKKSVFDSEWKRTYEDDPEMAARERKALQEAQAKKAKVMPLFNKGGLQYSGDLKMTELGKRRP
jgi:hypothetical protein